ncbi:MAG: hypothetical protein MR633_00705 [Faecalibacterium prausnitzii]|nr:hypothetical protein [Faecalibacterium prausnitzii]
MKKSRLRMISAALAVCMMTSVLPMGAMAQGGGMKAENSVGVQEQTAVQLKGGEKITDDNNAGRYTMSGPYNRSIIIDVTGDVIIDITGPVEYGSNRGESLGILYVKNAKSLTINNENNYEVKAVIKDNISPVSFLQWGKNANKSMPSGELTVNGGIYRQCGYGAESFLLQDGIVELNHVTAIATDNENLGGTKCITNSGATVTINGGEFVGENCTAIQNELGTITLNDVKVRSNEYPIDNDVINYLKKGAKVITINGGTYQSTGQLPVLSNPSETSKAVINGGTFLSKNGNGKVGSPTSDSTIYNGGELEIHGGYFENSGDGFTLYSDGDLVVIDEKTDSTTIKNNSASQFAQYFPYVPAVKISSGTFQMDGGTIESPNDAAIYLQTEGIQRTEGNIAGGCIQNSRYGIAVYPAKVTLGNVEFSNNQNDIYLSRAVIGIQNTFTGRATVLCDSPAEGKMITQFTDGNLGYQKKLDLISNNPEYIVGYVQTSSGVEYRNLQKRTGYTVEPENATATTGEGDSTTSLDKFTQVESGTLVSLTAQIPEGKKFTGWKVEKADGTPVTGLLDAETENTENTSFSMPKYDVIITAEYGEATVAPDIPADGGAAGGPTDNIGGAISAVVVGAAAGAIIYEAGTGIYRAINMPGIAMPSDRIELAELLWERADKPEPVSTALYSDIDENDTDAQKAARWAVEQELMKDNGEKNTFNPHFPVSKLRICLTWNAAKEKGLFDTDKTAE